jgi:branched-chain amino acid transport system ATP-binding protein
VTAAPSDASALLETRDIHASYGKTAALHGVSLSIAEGEIVALLGANGAGKSTTLRTISGLMHPTRGAVLWRGEPIHHRPAEQILRLGIAHCPEERHVWPEMTVDENLELGAYVCPARAEVSRRRDIAFQRFPRLKERRRQLAGTLSGGEQQMLAIARALMSEPRLLVLDEPTLGLSPVMCEEVLTQIRDINAHGVTVVIVEQNVQRALAVASRAYVFETGRIIAEDRADALLNKPELLKAYLGG